MLSGLVSAASSAAEGGENAGNHQLLKDLVLVYFAPETLDNLELRQCLSYFFPVFCYSRKENMRAMAGVRVFPSFPSDTAE